jgi:flagellar motor protein MotB
VSAELVELRQNNGVLRLAVRLINNADKDASPGSAIKLSDLVLVDAKSKKKHFPLRGADGNYIGGPASDWGDGGRWWVRIPAHSEVVIWAFFEALPQGSKVSVQVPGMFPFDDLPVTEGVGSLSSGTETASEPPGLKITLVSAKRAEQELQLRLKMVAGQGTLDHGALVYRDVFFFDPRSKRKYALLKDQEGNFLAQPISDRDSGGRYWTNQLQPGTPALMSLTFQAPPDDVVGGDLLVPGFLPMEGVAISGQGGAGAGGIAAEGKSLGLEGALKELKAEVTAKEIKINLSADVLFDFDKSDLKPTAEAQLQNLLTVVRANPAAAVRVEGHTDGRGAEAYNQGLSVRRAGSVMAWLVAHGVSPGTITTKGWALRDR